MNYDGIGLVDKPKIVKIIQAVQLAELVNLYATLRNCNESLRLSFTKFLALNPLPGYNMALNKLTQVQDPLSAVRAAAVCLLISRVEGNEIERLGRR